MCSKGGTFAPPEPIKTKKEVCDEDNYFFCILGCKHSHSVLNIKMNPL